MLSSPRPPAGLGTTSPCTFATCALAMSSWTGRRPGCQTTWAAQQQRTPSCWGAWATGMRATALTTRCSTFCSAWGRTWRPCTLPTPPCAPSSLCCPPPTARTMTPAWPCSRTTSWMPSMLLQPQCGGPWACPGLMSPATCALWGRAQPAQTWLGAWPAAAASCSRRMATTQSWRCSG